MHQNLQNNIKKSLLFSLLCLELYFAFGLSLANEFDDYLSSFIMAVIFFLLQVPLLYGYVHNKVVSIFLAIIAIFYGLGLWVLVQDYGSAMSFDNWPDYSRDYKLVVFLIICIIILQLIKLVILYLDFLKSILKISRS